MSRRRKKILAHNHTSEINENPNLCPFYLFYFYLRFFGAHGCEREEFANTHNVYRIFVYMYIMYILTRLRSVCCFYKCQTETHGSIKKRRTRILLSLTLIQFSNEKLIHTRRENETEM